MAYISKLIQKNTRSAVFILSMALCSNAVAAQATDQAKIQELQHTAVSIEARLEALEALVDQEKYLSEMRQAKLEFQELMNGLNSIGRQVSLGQMFLSSQFFTIFGLVFAVAGLISGVVANGMIRGADARIASKIKTRVNEEVMDALEDSSHYVTAKTHGQQAFAWWDHYNAQFQLFLRNQSYDNSIVRDIRLSKDIAAKGLNELDKVSAAFKADEKLIALRADLINHWVYNRTAEALLDKSAGRSFGDEERDRLRSRAVECLRNARTKVLEERWYNFVETAQFCLLKFGDEAEQREARSALLDLFVFDNGRYRNLRHAPKKQFTQFAFENYFPVNPETGQRLDLHGLGKIPQIEED